MTLSIKEMMRRSALLALCAVAARAANPIVPGVGMADPHAHVWASEPDRVYLYATHDCNKPGDASQPCVAGGELGFLMTDWWVWSSTNLVNWTLETKVYPSALPYENVNTTDECWATDAAFVNGKYYFYVSAGGGEVGVMSAPSLKGPWTDPLGKPLLSTAFGS